MRGQKEGAREKILRAAEELAREAGPGQLSLEAVAARAAVSKGGLLYHFPTKAKLLQALVETHLQRLEQELDAREHGAEGPDAAARAYLELFIQEHACYRPPPCGVLAALLENPDFLSPLRRHKRLVLDRMKADASDPAMALIVFLALEGIRCMELLHAGTLDDKEESAALEKLMGIVNVETV